MQMSGCIPLEFMYQKILSEPRWYCTQYDSLISGIFQVQEYETFSSYVKAISSRTSQETNVMMLSNMLLYVNMFLG